MNPDHYLVLGIISAIVAHDTTAVEDMLTALARANPKRAEEVRDAIARGLAAHPSTAHAEARNQEGLT